MPQQGGPRVAPTMAMPMQELATPPMGAPNAHVAYQEAHQQAAHPAHLHQEPAPQPSPRGNPRPPETKGKAQAMTMMAGTALGMSEAFNAGFRSPFPGWRAELSEPVGPSTGGGKQALQPISIESHAGERLAIGRVDPVRRSAALRSYTVVSNLHSQRYSRPIPVSAADYDRFIAQISTFFRAMQFGVTEERYVAKQSSPPRADAATGGNTRLLWMILFFMVTVAFALLIYTQIS